MIRIGRILLAGLLLTEAVWAQVVPDGGTATTTSTDSSGVITVQVAPVRNARDAVSYNTYTHFNAPKAGLRLDNVGPAARTIINEVTSTNISRLEGSVRVLGTRAHVIIANPNGILVDGARFINTGNVALTTGEISFSSRTVSGGGTPVIQEDIVVTTSKGKITIGAGGLSGSDKMHNLDLIAKELEVNGSVVVESSSPLAKIDINQGQGSVRFNSDVKVNAPGSTWRTDLTTGGIAQDQLTVDITRAGSLLANSINIVINDQGAGFRHAGEIVASIDQFNLTSTGLVELNGGLIDSTGHAIVHADEVKIQGVDRQARIKSDNGGLLIKAAGSLTNIGGLLEGHQTIAGNTDSKGGLTLNIGGDLLNRSTSFSILGAMFSEVGAMDIEVAGNMRNESGRLFSNGAANINVAGDFTNTTPIADFSGRGVLERYQRKGHRPWYSLFLLERKIKGVRINYGVADIEGQDGLLLADGDINLTARNVFNLGGIINSPSQGNINVTTGEFVNERFYTGRAQFEIGCAIFCDRNAYSTVQDHGGRVQAGGKINITATTRLESIGGEFISNGDSVITSPEISARATDNYTALQRSQGLRGFFRLDDAKIIRADQGGTFISNMGKISFDTFGPIRIDGGSVTAKNGVDTGDQLIEIISEPESDSPFLRSHLGVFGGFL